MSCDVVDLGARQGGETACLPLCGQRVLVTGAGGQLGQFLIAALRDAKASVVALGARPGLGIDEAVDLADREAAIAAILAAAPHVVIHSAACTDVDGIERDPSRGDADNARATANVAEAARGAGAYLVAVGSDMVFSGAGGAPYVEDAQTGPVSAYGASKLAAERAVLGCDSSFAVARTAWLYGGPGKHFPRTVLRVLRERGEIGVVDDEFGSPTFAGDLAQALLALIAQRGAGIFHLVNEGRASRLDFARETARLTGFDPELVRPISTALFRERYPLTARRPPDGTLRNTRAAELGIVLRDWRDALRDYSPLLEREIPSEPATQRS